MNDLKFKNGQKTIETNLEGVITDYVKSLKELNDEQILNHEIIIGTDSQKIKKYFLFVTVIVNFLPRIFIVV